MNPSEASKGQLTLRRRAQELSKPLQTNASSDHHAEVLVFLLAHEHYAIETQYIKEVFPFAEYTPLPGTPAFLKGLVNLRRKIITVIDLRVLFNLSAEASPTQKLVLLGNAEKEFAIVGSTEALSAQGDERWRRRLDTHDEIMERHLSAFGGRKINQAGDGVFAVFDGPTKAARCALELVPALATRGIPIRAGVHIGECERRGDDWSGVSVHIGARVAAIAGAGEVLVSRTVRDLSAGSGLMFEDRGSHQLKGVPEEWQVFRVTTRETASR